MTDYSHPDHGEIVERTLDTRVHDNETMLQCTRCNSMVSEDEPEKFDEMDCDHYKEVGEKISDNL